jgi:hypothetical protein
MATLEIQADRISEITAQSFPVEILNGQIFGDQHPIPVQQRQQLSPRPPPHKAISGANVPLT